MRRIFLLACLSLSSCVTTAQDGVDDAKTNLGKWGLVYCLSSQLVDSAAKESASRAMGAYFQRGGHNREDAYESVRKFFDRQVRDVTAISSVDGKQLEYVTCLDAYESPEYSLLIEAQDKHLTTE